LTTDGRREEPQANIIRLANWLLLLLRRGGVGRDVLSQAADGDDDDSDSNRNNNEIGESC
jgi:hypothetical protein